MTGTAELRDLIAAMVSAGDAGALNRTRSELVAKKKMIEEQLASDKGDMMRDRAEFIAAGDDPITAQVRATSGTDHDWRNAARAALMICDKHIAIINAALKSLNVEIAKAPLTPDGREKAPQILVCRGSAEEVAKQLRDTGRKISSIVAYDGAVIACTWAS